MMSELTFAYAEGFLAGMRKHAVSGAMYAQALQNAASRSGARLAPKMMAQVAAQPRAKASPFLASEARTPGALTPSADQRGLQQMMDKVPFAGSEYHHDAGARMGVNGRPGVQIPAQRAAVQTFHDQLQQTGRVSRQPGIQQQLDASFGPAPGQRAATVAGSKGRQRTPMNIGTEATQVAGPATTVMAHDPTVVAPAPTAPRPVADVTQVGRRKVADLAEFYLDKDAGLRQALAPLMVAGGLATGGGALAHHMKQPAPITKTMVQTPTTNELPNFGKALQKRTNDLDAILGAR